MQIFIHRDDQDFGPYTVEEARHYIASGELLPEDHAWYEGAPGWMPLEEIPGVVPSGAKPKPINTGLPAWIPPRRTEESADTGATPPTPAPRSPRPDGAARAPRIARPSSSPTEGKSQPSTPLASPPPAPHAPPIGHNYEESAVPDLIPAPKMRPLGVRNMVIGALVCIAGAVATYYSYQSTAADPHGSFTLWWGAVLFGGVQFVRGLLQFGKKG